ncbi:MAG: type II/IV secretion system protein [Candidatus Sumerlaeia bacterium]|nr:type II/IV secretion system protein [Candidatus Sumerlaeia bacterium]
MTEPTTDTVAAGKSTHLRMHSERLAELLERGVVDPDNFEMAVRESHKTGEELGRILVRLGFCEAEDVLQAMANSLGVEYMRLTGFQPPPTLRELVPARLAEHYGLLPISFLDGVLRVAVADPLDMHTFDELRRILNVEVEPVVASVEDIDKARNMYYGIGGATMMGLEEERQALGGDDDVIVDGNIDIDDELAAEDASIVRFVNQIIQEAFRDRATDIHVEPFEKDLRIRYRIDGMLYEAPIPPAIKRYQQAIISRVKIMADMNIAERRLPQDGKIKIRMHDKEYDLRVSTVPTPYGESCAIRILSRESELCTLDILGFSGRHQSIMREMISKPHGIVLITGPTGSGKSTTLYASLTEINKPERKIITIEDPIEYRIPGVTQIQVQPAIGLTFARVLRTLLRQDPDVIMVGETRDPETAKITIQTALTGHLVFSTLHTNDAPSAVTRLEDMGVEPFLIASSVEGVVAQRLVRLLCPDCKGAHKPDPLALAQVNVVREDTSAMTFYKPVGCESCRYTGFRGRTAVLEMVRINEPIRRAIVAGASATQIKGEAIKFGMRPIRWDGWEKVKKGSTTIDEVLRVTMEDEFSTEDDAAMLAQAQEAGTPQDK